MLCFLISVPAGTLLQVLLVSSSNDMLLLTGDSQPISPESEYLLAEQILDIAAKFNTKKVFTLAASVTGAS